MRIENCSVDCASTSGSAQPALPPRLGRKAWFGVAVASGALLFAMPLAAIPAVTPGGAPPMTVVKSLVDPALEILRDKGEAAEERREKLRGLVDGHFDFPSMARSALGYHWRDLSPSQRSQFTEVFSNFIQDSYLSKIQDYSGQTVQFNRQVMHDDGYSEVLSSVIQPGHKPVPLNYQLKQQGGDWKIYDVTVDNISIVANYRNQFSRIINNRGFNSLLEEVKNKDQQIKASMERQ
jgi:phospholipid transport system substrate-binding protein